jgi:hypothetical protein
MKHLCTLKWILLAGLVFSLIANFRSPSPAIAADTVDHSIFADLLGKYVKNGRVDYAGFKAEQSKLDQYLEYLEKIHPEDLNRNEQYAFYIDAYNAWTIRLVLTGYPGLKSIKDLGSILQSPWSKEFVHIDGKTLTLDDIEQGILRPRFKDPRVHFVINCASKSCPPLSSEPYRGVTLDAQLDKATRHFVNAPSSYRLDGDTLWISSIFKWYSDDFNNDPIGFYLKYAEGPLKTALEERGKHLKVQYLDYDWSLNGN